MQAEKNTSIFRLMLIAAQYSRKNCLPGRKSMDLQEDNSFIIIECAVKEKGG
jgi:hypothetical protein